MKKYIILFILVTFNMHFIYAQKELWGVNVGDYVHSPGFPFNYGKIIKLDINGENPSVIHNFDSIQGYRPLGRLFLANNGKLYGTAVVGGETGPVVTLANAGVLFEYDLILNKYRVAHYFGSDNIGYTNPEIGVIEPTPGILIGATQNRIYKYDLVTESITFSNPLLSQNVVTGELMKASNGYIYGVSWGGYCQIVSLPEPYLGNVIKYDMVTNDLSFAHSITCPQRELKGSAPSTQLVEASPGKLYGTCRSGGINELNDGKGGTLFEFNINTNAFTKKIDFNLATIGAIPHDLAIGDNGKMYGICEEGGAQNNCSLTGQNGTLYEYDPVANTFQIKQYINDCISNDFTVRYPQFLMKTSMGHFIGGDFNGNIFKYDLDTNALTRPSYGYKVANLIEICRKPSYQEITVNSFDGCVGANFSYDVQNTNATTYQWLKNDVAIVGQTAGVLNLANLQTSDAGDYTCLMANECGTTTTMALHLTVNCLGTTTVAQFDKSIKLYPNPTTNWLNIELPKNIDISVSNCTVTNLLGQTVYYAGTADKIDVGQFQKGIYIVSLQTNYGKWNGKFVKR